MKIAADIFFYWKVPGYQVPVRSGGETRKISEGRSCCALDRYVPFFSLTFSLSLFEATLFDDTKLACSPAFVALNTS